MKKRNRPKSRVRRSYLLLSALGQEGTRFFLFFLAISNLISLCPLPFQISLSEMQPQDSYNLCLLKLQFWRNREKDVVSVGHDEVWERPDTKLWFPKQVVLSRPSPCSRGSFQYGISVWHRVARSRRRDTSQRWALSVLACVSGLKLCFFLMSPTFCFQAPEFVRSCNFL